MSRSKKTSKWSNLLIYIYVFDLCLLPTFHIAGLPFKIAYLIAFIWVILFFLNRGIRIGNIRFRSNTELKSSKDGRILIYSVVSIIVLTLLGELMAHLFTSITNTNPFRDAMFFYVVLLGSMGVGYSHFDYNKNYLIMVLAIYCGINITLSALGFNSAYFILKLYGYLDESGSTLSSIRIGGIFGNPNATLCVMNMLFMSIVVYIKRGIISIKSKPKLVIVVLLPLITNCFVNSRGEFLVTAAIEAYLIYSIYKQEKNLIKTVIGVVIIAVVIVIAYNFAIGYLSEKFPTVAYSIKRLFSIFDSGQTTVETDSFSDRPFIHADEFWDRFIKSPIWGTGFSAGRDYPFQRACSQYHNDWFRIMGSSGVIGLIIWIKMIIIAVKKCGYVCILPFAITAISNSFIASPQALGIYFILTMSLIRFDETESLDSLNPA